MEFPIFDLVSQGWAVQKWLRGKSQFEKLQWLGKRGRLKALDGPGDYPVFEFESYMGLEAVFWLDGDRFVFIGGHTAFPAKPCEAEAFLPFDSAQGTAMASTNPT